jgi:hypothetical protein
MLLDELIEFDIQELTQWKIIFSFYKTWWLVLLSVLFLGVGCFFFLALFLSSYPAKIGCLLFMFICFFLTLIFSKQKTLRILTMHAEQYDLPINDLWRRRKITIERIRLKKLTEFIAHNGRLSTAKIRYFREELSMGQGLPRHQSQFSQIALPLISVILAGFFTAVTVVKDLFISFNAVVVFFKPYVGILLMFLLFYWFFERVVIKWLFEINQNRSTRLRKVLGNYLAKRL